MKKRICFIDDDVRFEIPLFEETFRDEFDLVTAKDYAECESKIKGRQNWAPDLFVLDLHFPSGDADDAAVNALRNRVLKIPNDRTEIRQAYLNYIVAQNRLRDVLRARKQSADGGIQLARTIRHNYPRTPIVFYSRKASAADVLRCMNEDGVLDVISKPSGETDEDTRRATMELRKSIGKRFKLIINTADSASWLRIKEATRIVWNEITYFANLKMLS